MSASKFAKKKTVESNVKPKGHLVVDVNAGKMAKVGDTDAKSKKILKDAGIVEDKKASKSAKPAKAPKADKEPKERVVKDDNRKISNVTKENPHREGSGRYEAYEAVKKSKKVSDYLAAGHKPKYLNKWVEQELITVSE